MQKKISLLVILGLILGVLGGLWLPELMNSMSFIGTIYINILKFMIVPIVFTSVTVTVFYSKREKTKLLIKTIPIFILMFIVSYLLTTALFFLIDPVDALSALSLNLTKWQGEHVALSLNQIIINLFPTNIATMIAENSIFALILSSFAVGFAASKTKGGEKLISLLEAIRDISYQLLEYLMIITPIAVFSLVGLTVANYGSVIIGIGAKYIALAYLAFIVTIVLVVLIPVWLIAKVNPLEYLKKTYRVSLIALSTCSSSATLPYTIKASNEEFKVSRKITDIVVPLGTTIHMIGGAVSFSLLALFSAKLFGIEISPALYLLMILAATVINMAAPGIPSGGIVLGATYLTILNIPLAFMGIYSGIYRLLDMAYTTLNVNGNIGANILIDRWVKGK